MRARASFGPAPEHHPHNPRSSSAPPNQGPDTAVSVLRPSPPQQRKHHPHTHLSATQPRANCLSLMIDHKLAAPVARMKPSSIMRRSSKPRPSTIQPGSPLL